MKILANDGISAAGQQALENAGYTVITDKVAQDDIPNYLNTEGVEILLVRSATTARAALIDACPNLKLIGRGGVGMDNIDVSYAREKGITVINTPASSSQSVAELVMGHLFAISRFMHDSFKHMEHGDFSTLKKNYGKGVELRGKTIGILGFGRIGQSLASYALGAGMNVVPITHTEKEYDIPVLIGNGTQVMVKLHSVKMTNEALGLLDYLSIHVPKQANGSAVIGSSEFNAMKRGIRLVNAARGGVIDEQALLDALANGTVAAAALDVFNNEPNPDQRDRPNCRRLSCVR